ncbi:unnamed protein product [Bemisia tabaci]|uniref:Uncharacterized protein n=1 Tax=Bemisia tabaci TaxID=7038 RepID=A0A9P0AQG4_BEMTA|nr:unnamed protein product [Bemisia tabaci]
MLNVIANFFDLADHNPRYSRAACVGKGGSTTFERNAGAYASHGYNANLHVFEPATVWTYDFGANEVRAPCQVGDNLSPRQAATITLWHDNYPLPKEGFLLARDPEFHLEGVDALPDEIEGLDGLVDAITTDLGVPVATALRDWDTYHRLGLTGILPKATQYILEQNARFCFSPSTTALIISVRPTSGHNNSPELCCVPLYPSSGSDPKRRWTWLLEHQNSSYSSILQFSYYKQLPHTVIDSFIAYSCPQHKRSNITINATAFEEGVRAALEAERPGISDHLTLMAAYLEIAGGKRAFECYGVVWLGWLNCLVEIFHVWVNIRSPTPSTNKPQLRTYMTPTFKLNEPSPKKPPYLMPPGAAEPAAFKVMQVTVSSYAYLQFGTFPSDGLKRIDAKQITRLFPYTSATDKRHMTTRFGTLLARFTSPKSRFLRGVTSPSDSTRADIQTLLRAIPFGQNQVAATTALICCTYSQH